MDGHIKGCTLMSKKTKPSKKPQVVTQPSQPQVDPALLSNIGAMRALVQTHNLLDRGHFNHREAEAVRASMEFIKTLYEQVKTEALSHPDSDKVKELVELKAGKPV